MDIFETRLFKEDIPAIANSLAEIAASLGRLENLLQAHMENNLSNRELKDGFPAALGAPPWKSELETPETGDN